MTWRKQMTARFEHKRAELETPATPADAAGSTAYEKLLRAAESGQFETLVGKARPAQPVAMVTADEREAELGARGGRPAEAPDPQQGTRPALEPARADEPMHEPIQGPIQGPIHGPPSPSGQYMPVFWRPRGSYDERDSRPTGRVIHDYDPTAEWDEE